MSDPTIGRTIADRYRVLDVIGRGGSATVYKALDTRRNTVCALKLLDARFADDFVLKERIQQEVKVSLRLKHPNLVRVFDVGEADGQTYLVMEYVERSLAALLVEGKPITADLAIEIVRRVGAALSYVHSQGLVHRDIKPSNILISSDNRVLLSDLGLAIVATQPSLTERGAVLGTPQYMSPEQAQGEPLDARSDIYSLGMVLYEMLTGRVAFTAGSTRDILRQQVHQDPIPLRKLAASRRLRTSWQR
jgi:serine/threonine protein kinase